MHITSVRAAAGALLLAAAVISAGCGSSSSSSSGAAAAPAATTAQSRVAAGRQLYETDGCSGCHSLTGERLTGPTWKGLAGSRVRLSDGRSILATDAYLTRHIVQPGYYHVAGYPAEVMEQATQGLDLSAHPAEVRALVAFIDSLR